MSPYYFLLMAVGQDCLLILCKNAYTVCDVSKTRLNKKHVLFLHQLQLKQQWGFIAFFFSFLMNYLTDLCDFFSPVIVFMGEHMQSWQSCSFEEQHLLSSRSGCTIKTPNLKRPPSRAGLEIFLSMRYRNLWSLPYVLLYCVIMVKRVFPWRMSEEH